MEIKRQHKLVALGVAAFLLLTGTTIAMARHVMWEAPTVDLIAERTRIVFTRVGHAERLVGGESILRIQNDDGSAERQFVLAKYDSTDLPPELIAAQSPREDRRILGISRVLDAREIEAGRALQYRRDSYTFHVFLDPRETYVLFDRLGGHAHGMVILLRAQPGERADQ